MIHGPAVVENEMSDTKRAAASTRNSNTSTSITGVTTIVDESPEVAIEEESYSEGDLPHLLAMASIYNKVLALFYK